MNAASQMRWTRVAACVVALAGGLSGARARAQYQPPPPPLTTAPCVPTKKEPCITSQPTAPAADNGDKKTDAFPFPGDAAPAAADPKTAFPFPDDVPAAPGAAKPGDSKADKPDASKPGDFPFPGDDSPGSSSSSSSSSGSSDDQADDGSDKPKLTDKGSEGSTRASRRKLPKVESMSDREAEDLNISKYYQSTGNFKAAYMRAQDAVKSMPDDSEAHFRLAQTAEKMDKKDEAIAEFNAYLKMDPDGDHVKAAKRALADLK